MKTETYIVTKDEEFIPENELKNYVVKESKALDEQRNDGFNGIIEPPYNPSDMLRLLDINVYHRRSCDVIANDVSGAGWTLNPLTDEASETNKEILLEFFNTININELAYKMEFDAEALGYGLAEVVRENGRDSLLKEINHFSPKTFKRHNDGVRVEQRVGNEVRWFIIMGKNVDEKGRTYDVNCKTGEISYDPLPENIRANELLWINRYTPSSSLYGVSPVVSAVGAIYGDHFRAKYNSSFFKNYGLPAFAVTITGDFDPLDENGEATLKDKIRDSLKEVINNPHSAMVIEIPSEGAEGNVSVEITPLSVDTKEASFTIYRKMNRDEILASHGTDPNRLSIAEAGQLNGNNSEQLDSAYKTSLIVPYRRQWTDLVTLRIIKEAFLILDWKIELIDSDVKNVKDDVDNILKLVNTGVITPNEAREYLSEAFNIQPKDDLSLNEHYYNGRALTSLGFDNTLFDNPFEVKPNEQKENNQ